MSWFRVLCTAAVLAIAGRLAAAQTPVTSLFENAEKVISDGELFRASNTRSLTSSSVFNADRPTGTWAPDSRDVDPLFSLDTDTPTLFLGPFHGGNLDGDGTLFLANLDFGAQGTVVKWGVVFTAVPEPSTGALMGLGAIAFGMRFMRHRLGLGL